MTALYGAGPIKRDRATRAEMARRRGALFIIIEANRPTGVRFTYYTAAAQGLVPKTQNGYRKVQREVLAMRRNHSIPWDWVVDSTRWMRKPQTWDSVEEAITATAASYRRALWSRSAKAVEVWVESESVAGVLYPITEKWDVPLYPIKGQTSDTFVHEAAMMYRDDPRELRIFYFGDHDPAGYEIESNLHRKLVEFSGRDDIQFHRIACTADDVRRLGLRGGRPKKQSYVDAMTGARLVWQGDVVEIEAIPPPTLRYWLDQLIEDEMDPLQLEVLLVAEASERQALEVLAGHRDAEEG